MKKSLPLQPKVSTQLVSMAMLSLVSSPFAMAQSAAPTDSAQLVQVPLQVLIGHRSQPKEGLLQLHQRS